MTLRTGAGRATVGAVVWALLVATDLAGVTHLTLIDLLLTLGPLVIVPLGLDLVPADGVGTLLAIAAITQLPAALLAVAAMLMLRGIGTALIAVAWLVPTGCTGLAALWILATERSLQPSSLARAGALGFLTIGAGWFVIDRSGVQIGNYGAQITELTAVHFHFAGFAATLIAALTVGAVAGKLRAQRFAAAGAYLVAIGTPLVALGMASGIAPLGLAGGVVLASGVILTAAVALVWVVPDVNPLPRLLLATSAVSVTLPMLLAVAYTARPVFRSSSLGIQDMAATHGILNSLGFILLGLLGWTALRSSAMRSI